MLPQAIPAGLLVTVPLPAPDLPTVNVKDRSVNEAVTEDAALMDIVHVVPVPEQPPLQPVNVEPVAGVAVSVTEVPEEKLAEQVLPHAIPPGLLVTAPAPEPPFPMVNVKDCSANVALTDAAAAMLTVQVPVPEQPPPVHPVNVDPAAGEALSVTEVPETKLAAQVLPHAMPAGLLVTVPLPTVVTLSAKV